MVRPAVLQLELFTQSKPAESIEPISSSPEPEPAEPGPPPEVNDELATIEAEPDSREHNKDPEEQQVLVTTFLTTEDLREQARKLDLPPQTKPVRRLGVNYARPLPDHLSKPVLPWEPTIFDELYAPVTTEILDQWQQADGTMMVVMRTPSGHTLCGRKAPWDPANPLYEPVPMFHKCAGGGRRKRR